MTPRQRKKQASRRPCADIVRRATGERVTNTVDRDDRRAADPRVKARWRMPLGPTRGGAHGASHDNDDLAVGMSLSLVAEGLAGITQRVVLIDDRRDLSGLDELLQDREVLSVVSYDEHSHALAHGRGQQQRLELTAESEPAPPVLHANQDVGSSGSQRPPAVR